MSRPSDHIDTAPGGFDDRPATGPRLGPLAWARWAWRQLTSMRTALLLLLALAVAAVPGSLVPQQSADPNGVIAWQASNPALTPIATFLQLFSVYTSVWFSAIYLLLFISLVGCVLPRVKHHAKALRVPPPRTPARLDRLPAHATAAADVDAEQAVRVAEQLLRRRRYRVRRYGASVSAERGYLRETGNLVFHLGLVGVLVTVAIGSGFTYTAQKLLVTGQAFSNGASAYDDFSHGRFVGDDSTSDWTLRLDRLKVQYDRSADPTIFGTPLDYTADVTVVDGGGPATRRVVKVNEPIDIGGAQVFLQGNGYAAQVTVRDADGRVRTPTVPFLPQTAALASAGAVKVPFAKPQGIGLLGFLYPWPVRNDDGTYRSAYPILADPLVTFNVYVGDLHPDIASNAYTLDTTGLENIAGPKSTTGAAALMLTVGKTVELPQGRGSVTLDRIVRFASFDIHHDPSQGWLAGFVVLVVAGLITSLLVPRRRLFVSVRGGGVDDGGQVRIEYAALARGDDPGLERAVSELVEAHGAALARLREPGARSDAPSA